VYETYWAVPHDAYQPGGRDDWLLGPDAAALAIQDDSFGMRHNDVSRNSKLGRKNGRCDPLLWNSQGVKTG
jgi:hypothetical protein